ncbi:MAG: AAA family ATPase, partial [Candidatus Babeliales bacterium]|nr:AAA family ATPase [Candidatus Babeliales bacterium]
RTESGIKDDKFPEPNQLNKKIRDFFGPYFHAVSANGEEKNGYHDDHPLKALGNLEKKMFDFQHGLMPIGAALLGYRYLFDSETNDSYNWFKKKIVAAHNNLLGGAYASRKTASDDGMISNKEPRITFDDIVGMEHAKDVLSLIVKYIEDPERWDRAKIAPEKGYLLTGPTRTGKSYMAEGLCGEIKRALKAQNRNPDEFGFYEISATLIQEKGMEVVMHAFKSVAPCVLFIDEIDLLGLQRAGGNSMLLNQFLVSMSGALDSDPKKQIIILAATNKPENMDEALKQPGRFGKEIRFDYPNFNYRKSYLTKRLSPLGINLDAFDLDKIALQTAGCSFEKLNTVIKVAFSNAKKSGHTLTQKLLEKALDSEIRLIRMDEGKDIPIAEKTLISVHQAGHTLATALLKTTHEVSKVTILPVQAKLKEEMVWQAYYKEEEDKQNPIEYGKLFTHQKHDTLNINSKDEMINMCKIQLAGHIAEEILSGSSGYTYHKQDTDHAMQIATAIVCEGLRMDRLPKNIQSEMFDKAFKLLNTCKKEMRALFTEHKATLQAIANELQKNLTLTASQIETIMQTGKLPDAATTKTTDSAIMASELGINEELPITA